MYFRSTFYSLFLTLFLVFISNSASAAIANAPARELWSLSTSDTIAVNAITKSANASVYLNAVDGTLYRATATTTASRLRTVAATSVVDGKGNLWLTGAILAAGLTYEGYKWYQEKYSKELVPWGLCGMDGSYGYLSDCESVLSQWWTTTQYQNLCTGAYLHYGITIDGTHQTDENNYVIKATVSWGYCNSYTNGSTVEGTMPTTANFIKKEMREFTTKKKIAITDEEVENILLPLLSSAASSRDAFSDGSMPYPMSGLFTNDDLAVDPTYSPQADINTQNLNDYITKYNNGLLQTIDPSAANYVTPAQYAYIKSQAEQAAVTAAKPSSTTSGANSTNPLSDMEQPITQAQYDESNKKTDDAAASGIKSTDWAGVNDALKLGDGANDALDKMAKGIEPSLPIIAAPNFPEYSSCRTIDMSWNGYTAVFPTASQCIKMEEFKTNLGYFLYLLTAVGLIFELLRRVD